MKIFLAPSVEIPDEDPIYLAVREDRRKTEEELRAKINEPTLEEKIDRVSAGLVMIKVKETQLMQDENPISTRTTVSTDKLQASEIPPTKIVGDKMELDPILVVKAWSDSADVIRDVAKAIRENQEDNDHTRSVVMSNRRMLIVGGTVITLLQIFTVVAKLL